MITHGSLSIEKPSIRWSKADRDAYLTAAAIGILAGLAVTYLRTPLHWPGHKVVFWMAPALGSRLVTRARAAASTSTLATIAATLLLGGQLAGGYIMMPLVALAGIILDVAARIVEHRKLSAWSALPLLALAGLAGNLLCFVKRVFDPIGPIFSSGNLQDLLSAGTSYAVFGLMAGLAGALFGWGILRLQKQRAKTPPKPN